jgi:tripartite-type tricarboxylate transporter receptor subunit TctC
LFDSGIHKARDQLAASGVDSRSMTPDQLRKFLRNEYAAWVALDRLLKFPRNEL